MPLGDSIARGSYLARYEQGPRQGEAMGRPNPDGGGWRKPLQDFLRNAGVVFDFVGDLNYAAYGHQGVVDSAFDPDHQGLAGFGNRKIMTGGQVPTLPDVLDYQGVSQINVPDLPTVLKRHQPDVILLMSGSNGFDSNARDELVRLIGNKSDAHLFVATIIPQRPPRVGWEAVADYNATLAATVAEQRAKGHAITFVDLATKFDPQNLLPDGVHPNQTGMRQMAAAWFEALRINGVITDFSAPHHP